MSTNCIHCGANPRDDVDLLCTGCRRERARQYVLDEGTKAGKRLRESSREHGLGDEQHARVLMAANELAAMLTCLAEHVGHPGTKYDASRLMLDFVNDILLTNLRVVGRVGEAIVLEVSESVHREAAAAAAAEKGGGT